MTWDRLTTSGERGYPFIVESGVFVCDFEEFGVLKTRKVMTNGQPVQGNLSGHKGTGRNLCRPAWQTRGDSQIHGIVVMEIQRLESGVSVHC